MFELRIQTDFAAAHALRGYAGKCARLHGHTFKIEVAVGGERLNELGMLVDFAELRRLLAGVLEEVDHTNLNDHSEFQSQNPTAENLARFVFHRLDASLPDGVTVLATTIHETERASATYRR